MASLSATIASIASDSQVDIVLLCHMPYATEVGKGIDFVIQLGKRGLGGQGGLSMWQNCAHTGLLMPVLVIHPHQLLMAPSTVLSLWWVKAPISSLPTSPMSH